MSKDLIFTTDSKYKVYSMSRGEFFKAQEPHRDSVFAGDHSFDLEKALSDEELESVRKLHKDATRDPYALYLGLFDSDEQFVGWSFGFQKDRYTYYMCNSAVLENHRRKGLYTVLMEQAMDLVSKKGYQVILSRHNATNNSVIIPKLKAGFLISSLEMDDVFGVLVHLKYFTNPLRRKAMDYRSGQTAPDDKLKELFGL